MEAKGLEVVPIAIPIHLPQNFPVNYPALPSKYFKA